MSAPNEGIIMVLNLQLDSVLAQLPDEIFYLIFLNLDNASLSAFNRACNLFQMKSAYSLTTQKSKKLLEMIVQLENQLISIERRLSPNENIKYHNQGLYRVCSSAQCNLRKNDLNKDGQDAKKLFQNILKICTDKVVSVKYTDKINKLTSRINTTLAKIPPPNIESNKKVKPRK